MDKNKHWAENGDHRIPPDDIIVRGKDLRYILEDMYSKQCRVDANKESIQNKVGYIDVSKIMLLYSYFVDIDCESLMKEFPLLRDGDQLLVERDETHGGQPSIFEIFNTESVPNVRYLYSADLCLYPSVIAVQQAINHQFRVLEDKLEKEIEAATGGDPAELRKMIESVAIEVAGIRSTVEAQQATVDDLAKKVEEFGNYDVQLAELKDTVDAVKTTTDMAKAAADGAVEAVALAGTKIDELYTASENNANAILAVDSRITNVVDPTLSKYKLEIDAVTETADQNSYWIEGATRTFKEMDERITDLELRPVNPSTTSMVNGKEYDTVEEAVAAINAAGSGTLSIVRDATLTTKASITGEAMIDLRGNTLDTGATYLEVKNGAVLELISTKGPAKISDTQNKRAISIAGTGKVVIGENVEVDSDFTATIVLSDVGSTVVLDGGKVTNPTSNAIQVQTGSMTIINSGEVSAPNGYAIKATKGGDIQIHGGKISGKSGALYASCTTDDKAEITIDGGTFECDTYAITLLDHSHMTISGDVEVKGMAAIFTNGSESPNVVIDLLGGKYEGSVCGVYLPNGTLNVGEGVEISGPIALAVRGGALNVNGAKITGTGTEELKIGDTGYNFKPAAISVDKNSAYAGGRVDVKIAAGEITAPSGVHALEYTELGEVATAADGTIVVTGGSFSDDSADKYRK